MKILSKKQQDEILKRIAACEIICINCVENIEAFDKMIENLEDISFTVGGESGADKVMNTVHKYNE